tara:strand:- start:69 stop:377 length:309 start_codon:yes stop_codon:yes gene_type:complete
MRRRRTRNKRSRKFDLKAFVLREAKKLQRESLSGKLEDVSKVKAKVVDAGKEASSLEKDVDFIKALKIKENRLRRQNRKIVKQVKKLQEKRRILRRRVIKKI